MPKRAAAEVIRKLRERATPRDQSDVDVAYRVTGGSPGEQGSG